MRHRTFFLAVALPTLIARVLSAQGGPLDNTLLLKTPAEAWAGYHGDSTGRHYSALNQINSGNVHELSLAWVSRVNTANQGAVFGGDGADPAPTPGGCCDRSSRPSHSAHG